MDSRNTISCVNGLFVQNPNSTISWSRICPGLTTACFHLASAGFWLCPFVSAQQAKAFVDASADSVC